MIYVVRGKSGEVWLTAATLADVFGESPIISAARISAVAADGSEMPLPSFEEALARNSAALASIVTLLAGLVERPHMYAVTAEALELQALLAMDLRRDLLGTERDRRPRPSGHAGVYQSLLVERFGETSFRACHAIEHSIEAESDEVRTTLAVERMAEFVAEWWRREQETTK